MPPINIRGLSNFIADIESSVNKKTEEARVARELSKVASRLSNTHVLSAYERLKCVWKLAYCYMLGYDITFGQIEAVNLIPSTKFFEKFSGYIASSMLLNVNSNVLGLLINFLKVDIHSSCESIAALGLNFLANASMEQILHMTSNDIQHICNPNSQTSVYLKKKAYLVLLRFLKIKPDIVDAKHWITLLLVDIQPHFEAGYLTALISLTLQLIESQQGDYVNVLKQCSYLLNKIYDGELPLHGMYNNVPCPWLQIKLLRILQYFSHSSTEIILEPNLNELICKIVQNVQISFRDKIETDKASSKKNKRKNIESIQRELSRFHAEHSILFEAVNVIHAYGDKINSSITSQISQILSTMDPTIDIDVRFLRMDALSRLSLNRTVISSLDKSLDSIIRQLYEPDESFRYQALDLLYIVCSKQNWQIVLNELLNILKNVCSISLQEELVIKIAILMEKYAPDFSWYIDAVFTMMEYTPSAVNDEVWHRVVQILSTDDTEKLKLYTLQKVLKALNGSYVEEILIRMGAYILGEFGRLILNDVTGKTILTVLHRHFAKMSAPTKSILLLTYAKLGNFQNQLFDQIMPIYDSVADSLDPEIQQRAIELKKICQLHKKKLETILACMPPYPVELMNESPLMQRLKMKYTRPQIDKQIFLPRSTLLEKRQLEFDEKRQTDYSSSSKDDSETSNSPVSDTISESSSSIRRTSSSSSSSNLMQSESSADTESDIIDSNNIPHQLNKKKLSFSDIFTNIILCNAQDIWKKACFFSTSCLLSTPEIEISIKHQYKMETGRLLLFITNIYPSTIQIEKINIESIDALDSNFLHQVIFPTTLSPQQSLKQIIEVLCRASYIFPPKYHITIRLSHVQVLHYTTMLPTIFSSFITPNSLKCESFENAWSTFSLAMSSTESFSLATSGKLSDIVKQITTNVTVEDALISWLSEGFHLYVQRPQHQENIIYGSGLFHNQTLNQSITLPFLILVKICYNYNSQLLKLIVRSKEFILGKNFLTLLSLFLLSTTAQVAHLPMLSQTTSLDSTPAAHFVNSNNQSLLKSNNYATNCEINTENQNISKASTMTSPAAQTLIEKPRSFAEQYTPHRNNQLNASTPSFPAI